MERNWIGQQLGRIEPEPEEALIIVLFGGRILSSLVGHLSRDNSASSVTPAANLENRRFVFKF